MIDISKILPTTMIALSIGASLIYLYNKDFKNATYWFAAATLNFAVVYM